MKNEWEKQLNKAFYIPEPKRKAEFLKNIRAREVNTIEMLWQQTSYIRISVWLFAAAIVAFAIGGSLLKVEGTKSFITMIMPFTAAAAVLETKRSQKYNMTELEMATRFSLRRVVFARMIVLGIVALFILCVSSPVIAVAFDGKIILIAIHILIPYLVTMIISLQLERSAIGRKTGYLSLAVAGAVAAIVYWVSNFELGIVAFYAVVIESWGIFIVIALLVLTIFEQWKTINNVEAFA